MLKSKNILYVLIILSVTAGILFATGAGDYFSTVNSYSESSQIIPLSEIPLTITISGWVTVITVVLGITRSIMLKQWKSLVLMLVLSYIGVAIYSLLDLRRLKSA